MKKGGKRWGPKNPIAQAAHFLASLDALTAVRYEAEGEALLTVVGWRDGAVIYSATLKRPTERARWWDHEPEEYDGA